MRYLSYHDVEERFGVSRSTIRRYLVDEKIGFPQPVKIGHRVLWREADLAAFDARLAGEDK